MSKYADKLERRRREAERAAKDAGATDAEAIERETRPQTVGALEKVLEKSRATIKRFAFDLARQKEKYNAAFDEFKRNQENRVARLVRRVERLERINKWLWEKNKNQRRHLANLNRHLDTLAAGAMRQAKSRNGEDEAHARGVVRESVAQGGTCSNIF